MATLKRIKRPWKATHAETKKHDAFYDSPAWRRKRKEILRRDKGLCQYCIEGHRMPGNTVDHTLPRRFFPELSFANSNLKVICDYCDGKKRKIESMCSNRQTCVQNLREGGFIVASP